MCKRNGFSQTHGRQSKIIKKHRKYIYFYDNIAMKSLSQENVLEFLRWGVFSPARCLACLNSLMMPLNTEGEKLYAYESLEQGSNSSSYNEQSLPRGVKHFLSNFLRWIASWVDFFHQYRIWPWLSKMRIQNRVVSHEQAATKKQDIHPQKFVQRRTQSVWEENRYENLCFFSFQITTSTILSWC